MISEISRRLDAVVEREVEIIPHLDGLIARDQRRKRHDAAVPGREAWAFPDFAENDAPIFLKRWSNHVHILQHCRRGRLRDR
jgi:hypothetical protein